MTDPNSTLLPTILRHLSQAPRLCSTLENICEEVISELGPENINSFGDVRQAVQQALTVGQNMGIIRQNAMSVSVPFAFRAKGRRGGLSPQIPLLVEMAAHEPTFGTGNPPPPPPQAKGKKMNCKSKTVCTPDNKGPNKKASEKLERAESEYTIAPPTRILPRNPRIPRKMKAKKTKTRGRPRKYVYRKGRPTRRRIISKRRRST